MIQNFLETLNNENTKATYRRGLNLFAEWLACEDLDVTNLRPLHVETYQLWLTGRLAGSSSNVYLSSLKAYLKWLVRREVIDIRVYQAVLTVENVKIERRIPRVFTSDELDDLLCQPDPRTEFGARDLALLRLLISSGARISELLNLDIGDVNIRRKRAYVMGKGGKERIVFFDDAALASLQNYLALRGNPAEGPLFVNRFSERLSRQYSERQIAAYGEAAGVEAYAHKFRHTFGTELLDDTGDIDAVSKLMGHADPSTTRIYTQTAVGRLERVYRTSRKEGMPMDEQRETLQLQLPQYIERRANES